MKCPVCPQSDIPDGAAECPSCGTDLLPIQRVRELAKGRFNEAVRLVDIGAFDSACARLAAAIVEDNSFVQARTLLGKLLWRLGQADAAVRQWQQATALAPEDEEIRGLLDEARRAKRRGRARRVTLVAAVAFGVIAALAATVMLARLLSQTQTSAAETAAAVKQLRADLQAAEGRLVEVRTWMQASLVPLFQSLRPQDADDLAARIQNLRERKNRLAARVEAYEKANLVPFRLLIFRDRLRKCEEELQMCEAEYEARVAPWERGMRMLRQNNVHAGGEAEK